MSADRFRILPNLDVGRIDLDQTSGIVHAFRLQIYLGYLGWPVDYL